MVDLKKEIRLSDLVPKRSKAKPASGTAAPKQRKSVKRDLVGLKIGASQLAAARVSNNGGARVLEVARSPLAAGVVVGGEVRDVPALARALDAFFAEHGLPRRGVRLGLGTNRVGVRAFEIDGIEDEKQLGNAVRFRASEAVSIPIDQAVLDYHVVGERVDDEGRTTRKILLAAAYRESIDRFVQACAAADVELYAIDLEAFALLRAVAPAQDDPDAAGSALVALAVGHDRSTLAVSDGTVCDFTRVLEWGGAKLEEAIGFDLRVTPDEARELKLAASLGAQGEHETAQQRAVRDAIGRELQKLARELVASLQFYQSQPGSLPIAEIVVSGGTSRLPGLPEELERLTRVRVRQADPLAHVRAEGDIAQRDDLASLTVAIGLGVEA
jgi:type IV pilus assembly protein PilM